MDADYGRNLDRDGAPTKAFEPSLFVWATVMSRPTDDRAIVDAGLKALAFDSVRRSSATSPPPPTSAPPTSMEGSASRAPPTASASATRSGLSPAIATRPPTSTTGTSPSATTASNSSGQLLPGGQYTDQTAAIPSAFRGTSGTITMMQLEQIVHKDPEILGGRRSSAVRECRSVRSSTTWKGGTPSTSFCANSRQ